jgi:ANTAR domain-containing protein
VNAAGRSADPRRASARLLDTAEGVLVALRGCSLDQAFVEIAQTAKAQNMSASSLADAGGHCRSFTAASAAKSDRELAILKGGRACVGVGPSLWAPYCLLWVR